MQKIDRENDSDFNNIYKDIVDFLLDEKKLLFLKMKNI